MKATQKKILTAVLIFTIVLSVFAALGISSFATGSGITEAAGWFESAYAEWAPVSGADGYNAYIASAGSSAWSKLDSQLVRSYTSYYRVDAVGIKAGNYQIKVVPTSSGVEMTDKALVTETLTVTAYDRSGYAHFNYTEGVGAYNDDGTLKANAIVIYVTDANKNTVSVTAKDGTTVTGIGNILNSVGQDVGGGKNSKGGIANSNKDIIRKLAKEGTPLVVRIIGNVTAPVGLTEFDSVNYGGSVGDNGFMARMSGGKDITIEGIGSDAVMNGWGLHFICQTADYPAGIGKSFEVRNLSFKNVPEDCVGMEGQQEGSTLTAPVERCWIHHCTFYAPVISNPAESDKDGGDGACDFKRGQYFTNSYCYYKGYHKTNLVGSSDSSLQYHLTYHHNYWKDCESRGPLARQANIHMYNNIFDGQTSYCMNPRANAYIFSEYNMFYKSKNPVDVDSGAVKSYGDSFASCTGNNHAVIVTSRGEKVSSGNKFENFDTNSSLSYIPSGDYIIQESIREMKAVVLAYAGTQKDEIITPDEVNLSEIPSGRYPEAAVSLDYVKDLNKSYITSTSGTYDNIVFNVKKVASDCITVGGTPNGCDIVFYVDTEVNISMTEVTSTYHPVLCNEYGEAIIVGTGSANNLPSGFYFIQAGTYDIGSAKFKEAKISSLSIYAVDPDAAPNPITPPPTTEPDDGGNNDGEGGNTGSGDSGNTGSGSTGGTVTGGTVITPDSQVHSFKANGKTDPEGFFSITGNTSSSKGSITLNGETLDVCLKIESSTNISFSATEKGVLVLIFGGSTNASGKAIKIDGTSFDIPTNQILEVALDAGSHSVTKDDSINLFYMAYVPADGHTHNYIDEETKEATCTETGIITYTCECGDSYTETVAAKGHSFVDGFCVDCGIDDSSYNEKHTITYDGLDGWLLEGFAPTEMAEGERVVLRTNPIMDADLELYANGVKIQQTHADADYWEYVFVMGDGDVVITKKIVEGFLPDTPVGPTQGIHKFEASDVELGADKDAISAGSTYADGLFIIEGNVIKRVDSGASFVKSIEIGKDLKGAVVFTIGADGKVTIVVSSTGGNNTSAFAIIDANGNVVNNNEGVDTVYGSMDSRITVTYELSAGTYKVVSPDHAEFDRGVRLYEISIDLGGEDNPGEDNPVCDCWKDEDGDKICDNCGSGGLIPPALPPCEDGCIDENGDAICDNCYNGISVSPDPTPNPGNPDDEDPGMDCTDPDDSKDDDIEQPEEKLNFFQRIFKAIADFFRMIFGIFKKK
ncbi:MAG: hypothetical protein IJX58_00125 [Clostridia bacterium]|nr:hypothetical protein [Clostridia bacterium]